MILTPPKSSKKAKVSISFLSKYKNYIQNKLRMKNPNYDSLGFSKASKQDLGSSTGWDEDDFGRVFKGIP